MLWRKTQEINDDHMTGIRSKFNRTIIQSNLDFDFTERVYDVSFYSFLDILSKLGGLRASILPILKYCMPLLTLHFLWKLSGIIDNAMHNNQQNELLKLLKTAKRQFLLIEDADEEKRVLITRD